MCNDLAYFILAYQECEEMLYVERQCHKPWKVSKEAHLNTGSVQ